jgi:HAE1 family hydrophobic/amphiphilic exporter-1
MTLIALALAIGLVIDDAIVVLESIYRRIERGDEPKAAGVSGSREVALAVVSTTLAVCAVFVPITFMQSPVGRYFYEFGVAVTVAVCASTLVALTLTPMLASRMLRVTPKTGWLFRSFERALDALDGGYRWLLGLALRRKGITVAAALASIVAGCGVASTLPFDLYTREDLDEASVRAKLPIGTPLAMTDRAVRRMEAATADHPDVAALFATAGDSTRHRPNRASLQVMLRPKAERERDITVTFDELRDRLIEAIPEAEQISVGYPTYADTGSGFLARLAYSLRGPDLARLKGYSDQLLARMRADPEFVDIGTSFETGKPQITLDIDRGRAADLGVPAVAIGRTIRALLAGEEVGSYEEAGRRHDVRIQVLPEYRDDPGKLDLIRVRSLRGELVPLTNAARVRFEEGPVEIRRENRTRQITVRANMAGGIPLGNGAIKLERWGPSG